MEKAPKSVHGEPGGANMYGTHEDMSETAKSCRKAKAMMVNGANKVICQSPRLDAAESGGNSCPYNWNMPLPGEDCPFY